MADRMSSPYQIAVTSHAAGSPARRLAAGRAATALLAVVLWLGLAGGPAALHAQTFVPVSQSCSNCGRDVGLAARVGQQCPHCRAYWGYRRETVTRIPQILPPSALPTSQGTPAAGPVKTIAISSGGQDAQPAEGNDQGEVKSRAGGYMIRPAYGNVVEVRDRDGRHIVSLPHYGEVCPEMVSADDRFIAVVTDQKGGAALYELPNGVRRHRISRTGCRAALFVPGDTLFIVKSRILGWRDPETNQVINGRVLAPRRTQFSEVIWQAQGGRLRLFVRVDDGRSKTYEMTGGRVAALD